MIDDLFHVLGKILSGNVHLMELKPSRARQLAGISALVIGLVERKLSGKAFQRGALAVRRKGGDNARIQSPADVCAYRDVAPQVQSNRFFQQASDLLFEILGRMLEVEIVIHLPIASGLHSALARREGVSRQYFPDSFKKSFAIQAKLERQIVLQSFQIGFDVLNKREQSFDFRGKEQHPVNHGVIKRLDAERIPSTEQRLLGLIPKSERKHAPELIDAVWTPLAIRMQNHLGIGVRCEQVGAQLCFQLKKIIDFTVVGDPIACRIPHGLLSSG